ncbi:endonuclease domain-containing protein [Agrobacterium tumefaciens]|uniref:endonuclease domain-containing protein n=1 Tax=Agrobacterium tumefaciens TaxID=358 RepID=UPI0015749436|nr:endonuclease domain-containing protein [Agrobacterium tumefaciens]NSZ62434.1 endonuclease domain-containing protein [Agrobacterium tumefaciens]NTA68806.1 endonuclease domain-containing protein [Agrobacterium tumefaciens]WIE38623.1 endonuclease domain-containing protein [Agrobacterium tumefaciens]
MPHADVDPMHRQYAKQMRKVMTDAELKLWNAIRAHRLEQISFRRQMPIAGFIVDFACSEVDGSQHTSEAALRYDQARTARLQEDGWTVLRFWNEDILRDIDNVCLHIIRTVKENRP